jgi:hypothetical protein
MVAGGFFDGDKVTIEPLGDICLMLEDYTGRRIEKLARMLYALAAGIKELKGYVVNSSFSLISNSAHRLVTLSFPIIFPPSTPRVYRSCMVYKESVSGQLAFRTLRIPNGCYSPLLYRNSHRRPSQCLSSS